MDLPSNALELYPVKLETSIVPNPSMSATAVAGGYRGIPAVPPAPYASASNAPSAVTAGATSWATSSLSPANLPSAQQQQQLSAGPSLYNSAKPYPVPGQHPSTYF